MKLLYFVCFLLNINLHKKLNKILELILNTINFQVNNLYVNNTFKFVYLK